jgi:EAL domain-containing protein (putative c-di-GMP-specific phosphodiesterase class I)
MVTAITQVAKVMELETVAEYVETDEILQIVTDLGVNYAQGFAIGRPIPLDHILQALTGKDREVRSTA